MELAKALLNGPFERILVVGEPRIALVGIDVADQIGDHFRVRFAGEGHAFVLEPGPQRGVVLDDPIVHDGDLARAIQMRMRIDGVGLTVCSPSRVPDPQRVASTRLLQDSFQSADATAGLGNVNRAIVQHGHTG